MKITVVTVVLNDAHNIRQTLESVLHQDWCDLEYLIIDGGSTDGTLEIIDEFRSKIHRVVSEPDEGIYPAMNKGIDIANGEFIHFMNCGDLFYSINIISRIFLKNLQSADIIYGDTLMRYPDGKSRIVKAHPPGDIWKPFFNHQAAFFRTSLLKDNPFDPVFRPASDFHFVMTSRSKGVTIGYIPDIVNIYLVGGDVFHREFDTIKLYRQIALSCTSSNQVKGYYLRKIIWIGFITSIIKPILPRKIFFPLQRLFRTVFPES